MILTKNKIELK